MLKISIRKTAKSFKFAFNGLKLLFASEHNASIHFIFSVFAIAFGFVFKITNQEWIMVVLSIGFVFAAELFNTAIEQLCNFVSPEKREAIKKIKDISAAAVLISAWTAAIIGLLIFLPKILHFIF